MTLRLRLGCARVHRKSLSNPIIQILAPVWGGDFSFFRMVSAGGPGFPAAKNSSIHSSSHGGCSAANLAALPQGYFYPPTRPSAEPPRLRRRPCRGSEPQTAPSRLRYGLPDRFGKAAERRAACKFDPPKGNAAKRAVGGFRSKSKRKGTTNPKAHSPAGQTTIQMHGAKPPAARNVSAQQSRGTQ